MHAQGDHAFKRAGHTLGTFAVLDGDQEVSATLGGGHTLHPSCTTCSTDVRLCSPDVLNWALMLKAFAQRSAFLTSCVVM
jgi:hypothetical protein